MPRPHQSGRSSGHAAAAPWASGEASARLYANR